MWRLLTDTPSSWDLWSELERLGVGGVLAVPGYWWALRMDKRNVTLEQRNQALEQLIRELLERSLAALNKTASALSETPHAIERVMADASTSSRRSEVDESIRALREQIDRMRDRDR